MKTNPHPKYAPVSATLLVALAAGITHAAADYPATVVAQGPKAYYRLNEAGPVTQTTATNLGSAGQAANGYYDPLVRLGQPGALAGSADTAIAFTGGVFPSATGGAIGAIAKVVVPYNAALNPSGPWTAEFWAKPNLVTGAQNVLDAMTAGLNNGGTLGGNDRSGWHLRQNGTAWEVRFGVNDPAAAVTYQVLSAAGAVNTNTWQHIVLVWDGATATLYTNGMSAVSAAVPSYRQNLVAPLLLGMRGYQDSFYNGSLDEVAIYGSALSAAKIKAHYDNGMDSARTTPYETLVTTDGVAGYWRLNETASAPLVAANLGTGGAAFNGTYLVGAQAGDAAPQSPEYVGLPGNTASLLPGANNNPAVNGGVYVPPLGINTNTVTISGWLKRNGDNSGWNGIVFQRSSTGGTATGPCFRDGAGNMLGYHWRDAYWGFNSGLIVPDGVWTYFAFVIRPDSGTIYMADGLGGLTTVVSPGAHGNLVGDLPLIIGRDPNFNDRRLNGSIDEVAIWDRSLSTGEVLSQYWAATGTNPPVIVAEPTTPTNIIYAGSSFSLTVDAAGTPNLAYQWRKGGSPLTGATLATYTKNNAAIADNGAYDCVITNLFGSTNTVAVTIDINPATKPLIDPDLPAAATRYVGGYLTLAPGVAGTPPFSYQWRKGGAPITGATNSSLVLKPIAAADAGKYDVVVQNMVGTTTSASCELTVLAPTPDSYASTVIGMGPLAYWRLNEANGTFTAKDYIGGYDATHSGSVMNGLNGPRPPTYPGLEAGNTAAEYNGTDTETTTGVSLMNNRSQFTILGWFKLTGDQIAAGGRVGLFGQNDVAEFGYHGLTTVGIWTPGGGFASFSSSLVSTGQWYFITATGDGANLTLYLDGRQVAKVAGTTANYGSSTSPFNIGYAILDATGNNFLGDVDEVAFFDRALSLPEIFAINSKATGIELKITLNPQPYLIADSKPSGTPHNGNNRGAAWVASSTDANTTPVTRQGVMQFTQTEGDQIVVPWNADFNTTTGAITFWIRSAGAVGPGNDGALIIDRRPGTGDVIVQNNAGGIFWQPEWLYSASTTSSVSDDNWHHVAYVFDQASGASVWTYIDGWLDTIAPANSRDWTWGEQQIEIGRSHDGWWKVFNGQLDDIRFYRRSLTDAEVQQIFTGDATLVGGADLAGRYNFDRAPSGLKLTLSWPLGVLESADSVQGPWTTVTGATSPYEILSPAGNKFFRLRL